MKQPMKKLSLALIALVSSTAIISAQSEVGGTVPAKQVKIEKKVILTEKEPAKEVKSVDVKKIEALPIKEKAIIEEKETNQK